MHDFSIDRMPVSFTVESSGPALLIMRLTATDPVLWNSDTTYALGLYRILGRILGIWPLKCNDISSKIRVAFIIITQLWMSISLLEQLLVKGNCGKVTDIMDVTTMITCGFLIVLKVIMPRIYQHNMNIIVNSAIEDWSKVNDKKSRLIMMRYAYIGRIVFISQVIFIYGSSIQLIVARLPFVVALWNKLSGTNVSMYSLPMGPSCWVPSDISLYHYVASYAIQSVLLIIICSGVAGCDTYFFGIAMHICGQFELLHVSLENLYGTGDSFDQKRRLSEFIKRHEHLLVLAGHFGQIFNLIILALIVNNCVLASISGIVLLITLQSGDTMPMIGIIIRIYVLYFQLFMYSYLGEQLSTQTENLRDAVYNNPYWYNMSPDIVRNMVFIIRRCSRPFNLTAGNMFPMNLSNFMAIVKTTLSYFSVLRLMFAVETMDN